MTLLPINKAVSTVLLAFFVNILKFDDPLYKNPYLAPKLVTPKYPVLLYPIDIIFSATLLLLAINSIVIGIVYPVGLVV